MKMVDDSEKNKFKRRVQDWANKLGVEVRKVAIRDMTKKWASCSTTGIMTFDVDLLTLPTDLQDYVIVHELLHIQVPNHGRLWKSLMRAHLGDFESQKERLDKITIAAPYSTHRAQSYKLRSGYP